MTKLKSFLKRVLHIKIRTKLILLILITGALCLTLFRFLWHRKWNTYYFLAQNLPSSMKFFPTPDDDFWGNLIEEAKKYNVPDSEDDKEAVRAIEPFFSLADEYTSISIYGLEDGLYRTSCFPEAMLWSEPFNTFFQMTYRWIDEDVNQNYERAVKFKNGYASIMVSFYHSSFFLVPYAIFCLFLCVFLFLFTVLFFVGKKIKTIVRLEQAILQMSSGDLITPVKKSGYDEIGILALELDNLRFTLHENFLHEQKVHQSNQELIAALSHDLRTPLTILKGYLEILRLNRNPDLQTDYISRCIGKADDLKEMTDRMFEYALVFDEAADSARDLQLEEMPISFFLDSLREHSDFLRLAGFQTNLCFTETDGQNASPFSVIADKAMAKRVLNNLFSNIIKYADKKEAVFISASFEEFLLISVRNKIKQEEKSYLHNQNHTSFASDALQESLYYPTGSTQIGLKSVRKMMKKMNGDLVLQIEDRIFTAKLQFSTKKPTL